MYNEEVYIVLINYNGWRDTIECIRSLVLTTFPQIKVVVVDNDSTDNSIIHIIDFLNSNSFNLVNSFDMNQNVVGEKYVVLSKNEEDITLQRELIILKSNANLGFSGGNNIGIQYAMDCNADYIMLLNNDTRVDKGFIEPLVDTLRRYENIGLVGGKIYDYNSKDKFIAGGYIDLVKGSGYHYYNENNDKLKEVSFLSGCLWMFKSDVIREVGFLDEKFFLYIEDVEFCYRLIKNGKKLFYNSKSEIYHKESQSTGKMSPLTIYYNTRNRLYFVNKSYSSIIQKIKFYSFFSVSRAVKIFSDYRNLKYYYWGVVDYLQKEFGKSKRF